MGEPIEKMMNDLQKPPAPSKKAMLEENVRTSRLWADALYRGTFSGADSRAVFGLIGFLESQHEQSLSEYEAESVKHPEWGRPNDIASVVTGPVGHS
jgi:hypothetical protein